MTTHKRTVLKASKKVMALGILTALLGIAALVYPGAAGNITAAAVGVFMIIGGILRLSVTASSTSWKTFGVGVFYGLLMIAAGVYLTANPDIGLNALTLVMASFFVIDGATQMYYAFKLSPIGGGSYLLVNALVSIAIGGLIFAKYPESSVYAMGVYLGLKLVIDGSTLAVTGYKVARFAKRTGKSLAEIKDAFAQKYKEFRAMQEQHRGEQTVQTA